MSLEQDGGSSLSAGQFTRDRKAYDTSSDDLQLVAITIRTQEWIFVGEDGGSGS